MIKCFFFFNDTATTEIYTLSLHDALPISPSWRAAWRAALWRRGCAGPRAGDRKSTRLNSSHTVISYAVFCLKKKKKAKELQYQPVQRRYVYEFVVLIRDPRTQHTSVDRDV